MSSPLSMQLGAVGAKIDITVLDPETGEPADISTMTLANSLYLRLPSSRLLNKTPSFITDGTDGQLRYVTISGDVSELGYWQAQAKVIMGGNTLPTTVLRWEVVPNLYP